MKNDTLLMHRLHGPDRRLSITRNKREVYLHFMARAVSRGANRRNFTRITCTLGAMALLSSSRWHIARRRSIIRTIARIQGARLKKKLSQTDWQQNLRRARARASERLICYHRSVIRSMFTEIGLPRIIIRVIPT